jgi:hypothetical protein
VLRQVDLIERTQKQIFAATKQIFWKKEKKKKRTKLFVALEHESPILYIGKAQPQ